MSFDYSNTGFFQVVVDHDNRTDKTYSFNGYIIDNSTALIDRPVLETGTFRVPVQAQNTKHRVSVRSSSYLPVNIVSAEITLSCPKRNLASILSPAGELKNHPFLEMFSSVVTSVIACVDIASIFDSSFGIITK